MSKITFSPPGPDEPGYLRRTRQALKFARAIKEDPSPQVLDDLVELLLAYVTQPEDRDQAREALWDATEKQFLELLRLLQGGNPLA